jgi:hypothetical protein
MPEELLMSVKAMASTFKLFALATTSSTEKVP